MAIKKKHNFQKNLRILVRHSKTSSDLASPRNSVYIAPQISSIEADFVMWMHSLLLNKTSAWLGVEALTCNDKGLLTLSGDCRGTPKGLSENYGGNTGNYQGSTRGLSSNPQGMGPPIVPIWSPKRLQIVLE